MGTDSRPDGSTPSDGSEMTLADIHAMGETAQRIADELRRSVESGQAEIGTLLAAWRGSAADAYDAGRETLHRAREHVETEPGAHRSD
ncbi:hypothetical protein SKPI104516_14160 [Skermania piniformis]